jgi:hypothetical protein
MDSANCAIPYFGKLRLRWWGKRGVRRLMRVFYRRIRPHLVAGGDIGDCLVIRDAEGSGDDSGRRFRG